MGFENSLNTISGTVSIAFLGHRDDEQLMKLDKLLLPFLKKILLENRSVIFYVGRNGNFDEYVASLIKSVKRTVSNENSLLILVLPYKVKDIEYYCNYYDEVIIPDGINGIHYKKAISSRNIWMIDNSDLVVFNVTKKKGGAYQAMKYAQIKGKTIWNISEDMSE